MNFGFAFGCTGGGWMGMQQSPLGCPSGLIRLFCDLQHNPEERITRLMCEPTHAGGCTALSGVLRGPVSKLRGYEREQVQTWQVGEPMLLQRGHAPTESNRIGGINDNR